MILELDYVKHPFWQLVKDIKDMDQVFGLVNNDSRFDHIFDSEHHKLFRFTIIFLSGCLF